MSQLWMAENTTPPGESQGRPQKSTGSKSIVQKRPAPLRSPKESPCARGSPLKYATPGRTSSQRIFMPRKGAVSSSGRHFPVGLIAEATSITPVLSSQRCEIVREPACRPRHRPLLLLVRTRRWPRGARDRSVTSMRSTITNDCRVLGKQEVQRPASPFRPGSRLGRRTRTRTPCLSAGRGVARARVVAGPSARPRRQIGCPQQPKCQDGTVRRA